MGYSIGDKVFIKEEHHPQMDGNDAQHSHMYADYAGKMMTIVKLSDDINDPWITLEEDNGFWGWLPEMFENSNQQKNIDFKTTKLPEL